MADMPTPIERFVPLMARYSRLDPFYQGYLDGHIHRTIEAFVTGLEIVEQMQADKRAQQKAPPSVRLRVVPGGASSTLRGERVTKKKPARPGGRRRLHHIAAFGRLFHVPADTGPVARRGGSPLLGITRQPIARYASILAGRRWGFERRAIPSSGMQRRLGRAPTRRRQAFTVVWPPRCRTLPPHASPYGSSRA